MQDDLSNLNEKFDRLKDVLIERLYTESYLTDELTMEFENGVGGNEAMIFTKELVNFYTQYCRKRDWAVSPVDLVQSNGELLVWPNEDHVNLRLHSTNPIASLLRQTWTVT